MSKSTVLKGLGAIVSTLMVLVLLPMSPAAAAATNVTAGASYSYTEQQGVIPVGSGITVTDGTSYAGEYLDFSVGGSDAHDILSLDTDGTASTAAGVVSIVGASVYLGNGTIAEPVGSVDSTFDGQAGRKLRVNFTTAFENPGFEDGGTLGWTALQQRIDLGATKIAGFTTNDTSTYPSNAPNKDNNNPVSSTFTVSSVTSGQPTQGTYALQLLSNMTTANDCDVVHGPAVYSSEFEAASGDKIYFDWRAFSGSDAYAVFGYIIDRNGNQTEVLDTYATTSSNTAWATKETVIPTGGHYRFVFVAGTSDATCGRAAGASLLIDNVKVFGSKATDDVAQQVARKLQYANTSDNPAAQRTITVTAKSNANGMDSDTLTVNITPVDDPFDASNPADVVFTNTATEGETFSPKGGQISVVDPDTTSFEFALAGSTSVTVSIGGQSYDRAVTTDYGTMYVDSKSGHYTFDPISTAIDSRLVDDLSQFDVTVTSGEFTDSVVVTMRVDIPEDVPGSITYMQAMPGNGTVELSWNAPTWIGGIGISGYRVYMSANGGASWNQVSPDDESGDTTMLVTGLDNGHKYRFMILAFNSAGESGPSPVIDSTPRTIPDAPTVTKAVESDSALTVTFAAPASDGGSAITAYKVSLDGGETWSSAGSTAGSVTLDGLTNGSTYNVVVMAENAAGTGAASTAVSLTPRTTPDAPTIGEIVGSDRELQVRIIAPDFDGGSPIVGYELSLDGGETFTHQFGSATEWATVPELANGTSYQVVIRAENEAGVGASSSAVSGTPRTVPGSPVVTGIAEGDGRLDVAFTAPASDGGSAITGYEISIDGGTTWIDAGDTAGTFTVDPLKNGTTYQVIIRASNAAGAGAASAPTAATPRTIPGTPKVNSITAGDGTLKVDFVAPISDGGATITAYEASLDAGRTWQSITGPTSAVFDGLSNGKTYQLMVRALNEAGAGVPSAVRSATPRTVATAPTITRIAAGNRSLSVFVAAPSSNGGAALRSYEVSLDNGVTWPKSFATDASPLKLFGLENGTTYPIRVRAINEAGAGPASTSVPGTPVKGPISSGAGTGGTGTGGTGAGGTSGGTGGSGAGTPEVDVPPGKTVVTINGENTSVDSTSTPGTSAVQLSGDGWTATIGGIEGDGTPMTIDSQGRLIVLQGGSVRVTGAGFAPGTSVDVWLFSTPTFLGDVAVGVDGTFDQMLKMPEGIEIGEHTVQMNGLGQSGEVYSVSTGLILKAAPEKASPEKSDPRAARLAFTGAASPLLVPWALAVLVAGVALVVTGRREKDERELDNGQKIG
ncbi:MAG: fibronectin type III domain-containing protein [Microthrixaceae bacterium]